MFRWHSNLAAGNIRMPELEPGKPPPQPTSELLASAYEETVAFLQVAPRAPDGSLQAGSSLINGLRQHGIQLTAQGAGTLLAICDRGIPSRDDFAHCCRLGTQRQEPQAAHQVQRAGDERNSDSSSVPRAVPTGHSPLRKLCSHVTASSSPSGSRGQIARETGIRSSNQPQRRAPQGLWK